MQAKNRRGSADGQSQDVLGPLQDLVRQLRSGARTKKQLVAFNEGRCFCKKKAEELAKLMKGGIPDSDLLSSVGVINVAATGKFFARDHFTTGIKTVKIACIGDNFKQWFSSKVEEPQTEASLRIHKLKKGSLDAPILDELGDKKETTLANIWKLLKKQPGGESGTLLTNGYANIFYVRDAKGAFRAVGVGWGGAGWGVGADSVAGPGEWRGGGQVFSRNS